jgi:hypothetical protein
MNFADVYAGDIHVDSWTTTLGSRADTDKTSTRQVHTSPRIGWLVGGGASCGELTK